MKDQFHSDLPHTLLLKNDGDLALNGATFEMTYYTTDM